MIVTCCRTTDRLSGERNVAGRREMQLAIDKATAAEKVKRDAEEQHEKWHDRRV